MLAVIDRASMFCVFLLLALVFQKSINSALYLCEHRIKNLGRDARDERKEYQNLAQLTETRLFGKCREMFHSTFNTKGAEWEVLIQSGTDLARGGELSQI